MASTINPMVVGLGGINSGSRVPKPVMGEVLTTEQELLEYAPLDAVTIDDYTSQIAIEAVFQFTKFGGFVAPEARSEIPFAIFITGEICSSDVFENLRVRNADGKGNLCDIGEAKPPIGNGTVTDFQNPPIDGQR